MKINWQTLSAVATVVAVLLGWAWSIEYRLASATDVTGRLKAIETALYPILVDYRVNQILRERENRRGGSYGEDPIPDPPPYIDSPAIYEGPAIEAPEPPEVPAVEVPERERPTLSTGPLPTGGHGFSGLPRPAQPSGLYLPDTPPAEVQEEAQQWARQQLMAE